MNFTTTTAPISVPRENDKLSLLLCKEEEAKKSKCLNKCPKGPAATATTTIEHHSHADTAITGFFFHFASLIFVVKKDIP